MYLCQMNLCNFMCIDIKEFLSHLHVVHGRDLNFSCKCPVDNCIESKTSYDSLYKHIQRKHREFIRCTHSTSKSNFSKMELNEMNVNVSENNEPVLLKSIDYDGFKKKNALYLLGLKDKINLTDTAMSIIIESTTSLVTNVLDNLRIKVENKFRKNDMLMSVIAKEIMQLFEDDQEEYKPFCGLETNHLQMKYFKENFHYVEPIKIELPAEAGSNSKPKNFAYIPLLKQLESILQNSALYSEIYREITERENTKTLRDLRDGYAITKNELFINHPDALQLLIYYDDVEFCNPLGSKSHKTGCVYFTLGNIRPQFRSKLKSIFPLAMFPSKLLKTFNFNDILKYLIVDIQSLENGVAITTAKGSRMTYGTVVAIAGDNLASNALGGFKECFRALRMCRSCLATRDEIQTINHESKTIARNKISHTAQCKEIAELTHLADHLSKTYGINRDTAFNLLKYYHVANDGLPPDLMHDNLEGTLHVIIKLMLAHYIFKKKYFSLDYLNKQISEFDYGYSQQSNKPSAIAAHTIKNDGKLKQSAAQMWCLAVNLPIMIASFIPEKDPYWKCLRMFLEICRIIFTTEISQAMIAELEILISDYITLHKKLFHRVLPKLHFLVHYPRYIVQYGPLRLIWCMRFESKHQFFKRISEIIRNFINLPYTLSIRGQLNVCYELNSSSDYFSTVTDIKQIGQLKVGNEKQAGQIIAVLENATQESVLQSLQRISINGIVYKKQKCLLLAYFNNILPQFGTLENIYVHCETIIFKLNMFRTLCFNKQFQAYEVENRRDCEPFVFIIKQSDLVDHNVYHLSRVDKVLKSFVVMREAKYQTYELEEL